MRALRSCEDTVEVGRRCRESGLGRIHRPGRRPRQGVATVELATLLPLLGFLLVATVDYARIFYYSVKLTNCARNGALYLRSSAYDPQSPYGSYQEAALADSTNLQPTLEIPPFIQGVDASGNPFIEVKAKYTFKTFANYPGIPSVVNLERSVRLPIAPDSPQAQ